MSPHILRVPLNNQSAISNFFRVMRLVEIFSAKAINNFFGCFTIHNSFIKLLSKLFKKIHSTKILNNQISFALFIAKNPSKFRRKIIRNSVFHQSFYQTIHYSINISSKYHHKIINKLFAMLQLYYPENYYEPSNYFQGHILGETRKFEKFIKLKN